MNVSYNPTSRDFDMKGLENYLVAINDFNVQTQIGKGGYGEVFYGIHIKTGRKVAIKKLILSRLEGPDLVYFNREVQILASCDNYFLLPLIGYSNSYPYIIVTDYVPCGSLFEALRHKPGSPLLTDTMKTKIGLGIAIGMIVLHDKNIIHRDLKSLNILISQETLPKICDFGIARFSNSGKDSSSQQNFFTANIGTPHWMAPEILQSGRYSFKVDVFSYAVILWEMLTEHLPFQGMKELYQVALKIIQGERNPIPLDAPIGLRNLINKLWSQDPDLRPDFREVYRSFASHEVYFGNTNPDEIDEFVKRFPMPEKLPEGEENQFNSDNGINSNHSANSYLPDDRAEFTNTEDNKEISSQNESTISDAENSLNADQNEACEQSTSKNSEYIESIRVKLSNGPSKPVRPPLIIQPVKLNISHSQLPDKKTQTQTQSQTSQLQTQEIESTQTQLHSINQKLNTEIAKEETNTNKNTIETNSEKIETKQNLYNKLNQQPTPPPQYHFQYLCKYLNKNNIFLQYFSEENQTSFLDGFNNDIIIEEDEEENEFADNLITNNNNNEIDSSNENTSQSSTNQLITLTSSSDDDDDENSNKNLDEFLNGSDSSICENFGQLPFQFHEQIKNKNAANSKELIDTISLLIKSNNKSIVFSTTFTEISILARKDTDFASILVQAGVLNHLPYERTELFDDILHIIIAILEKEPEFITDEIMKELFTIFMKKVDEQQSRIKKESKKDFDEIIEKEELDANNLNDLKFIIDDELKQIVAPFLSIFEKIGENLNYRNQIFDLYKEQLDLFINFGQFVDIVFYLSEHYKDFENVQKEKTSIFSKAISLAASPFLASFPSSFSSSKSTNTASFDHSSVISSGYRALARLNDVKYSIEEIPLFSIFDHLNECGPFTVEGLIIIEKVKEIPLSDQLIDALKKAANFSEKASLIVAHFTINLTLSSQNGEDFIFRSKIWLNLQPKHGLKIILILASKVNFQKEMIGSIDMVKYLTNALKLCSSQSDENIDANNDTTFCVVDDEQLRVNLVCSIISFIRYSKSFQNFVEIYSNEGFLHAAVDSTISSNNDKCIDQGLFLFDQLFHEGVWFNDFSYFVEKIPKVLKNGHQKQATRSIVVLLALGVMFPQSHPIMKDNDIAAIVAKININSNSVGYKNNLLQILNQK